MDLADLVNCNEEIEQKIELCVDYWGDNHEISLINQHFAQK